MPRPIRYLSILALVAFSASLGAHRWSLISSQEPDLTTFGLLPTVVAAPVDVTTEDTLRAGETLSELLARADLAESEARTLLNFLAEHQDPRRMRAGSVLALRRSVEDGALRRLQVRLDADRIFSMLRSGESWEAGIEEVPVQADTVVLSGVIESSLYGALVSEDGGGVPMAERQLLVDQVADRIFAWQIDFSRDLRRGDTFRIMYERLVRPDGTTRSGRVLSAQFNVNNRDYEAFAFAYGDDGEDYFDRSGESLRRAFLRAPLQYRRISSAFSRGRFHPVLRVNRPHNGIDYAAASGTPIYAVGDGVIRRAGNAGSYGNLVEISHNRVYSTRYAHLRGFARGIRPGVRVKQGEVIGYVGATGLATGPHLHYEFHANGRPIDPNSIEETSGDPVPSEYKDAFLVAVNQHVRRMDAVQPDFLLASAASAAPAQSD